MISVDWKGCEKMLSWPNLKNYVDWNGCERKISRTIWSIIWIRSDDIGLCHDQIWGEKWIGTDDKWYCHDPIYSVIWIGNNVT
jgi:hypothetical protein